MNLIVSKIGLPATLEQLAEEAAELSQLFYSETVKLREYYQMEQEDDGWLARQKLKEIGCDVEQWFKDFEDGGGANA